MNYKPPYHVSSFVQCPVLLTQPAEDHWTPLSLSQEVLKRLSIPHEVVMLPKGGHYPVEKEALDQLKISSIAFIEKNISH